MKNTRIAQAARLAADLAADALAKVKRPEVAPITTVTRLPDGFDGEGNAVWLGDTFAVLVDVTTMGRLHQIAAASYRRMPKGIRVEPFDPSLAPKPNGLGGRLADEVAAWYAARELLFVEG